MGSDSPAAEIKRSGDVTIYQAAGINAQLISAIRANGFIVALNLGKVLPADELEQMISVAQAVSGLPT